MFIFDKTSVYESFQNYLINSLEKWYTNINYIHINNLDINHYLVERIIQILPNKGEVIISVNRDTLMLLSELFSSSSLLYDYNFYTFFNFGGDEFTHFCFDYGLNWGENILLFYENYHPSNIGTLFYKGLLIYLEYSQNGNTFPGYDQYYIGNGYVEFNKYNILEDAVYIMNKSSLLIRVPYNSTIYYQKGLSNNYCIFSNGTEIIPKEIFQIILILDDVKVNNDIIAGVELGLIQYVDKPLITVIPFYCDGDDDSYIIDRMNYFIEICQIFIGVSQYLFIYIFLFLIKYISYIIINISFIRKFPNTSL